MKENPHIADEIEAKIRAELMPAKPEGTGKDADAPAAGKKGKKAADAEPAALEK